MADTIETFFRQHRRTRLGALKASDLIMVDAGFSCMAPWSVHLVKSDEGRLYCECDEGRHYLDGQLADDDQYLVGVIKAASFRELVPGAMDAFLLSHDPKRAEA